MRDLSWELELTEFFSHIAVQQLLPGFQLCQTPKKKGDVAKKVKVAPVAITPFSL